MKEERSAGVVRLTRMRKSSGEEGQGRGRLVYAFNQTLCKWVLLIQEPRRQQMKILVPDVADKTIQAIALCAALGFLPGLKGNTPLVNIQHLGCRAWKKPK